MNVIWVRLEMSFRFHVFLINNHFSVSNLRNQIAIPQTPLHWIKCGNSLQTNSDILIFFYIREKYYSLFFMNVYSFSRNSRFVFFIYSSIFIRWCINVYLYKVMSILVSFCCPFVWSSCCPFIINNNLVIRWDIVV